MPTAEEVLGHRIGDRITSSAGLIAYLEALESAVPGQVRILEYARSWEGRKLVYAFVGSPERIGALAEVSAGMKRLADPRKTPRASADSLIASLPVIVNLSYVSSIISRSPRAWSRTPVRWRPSTTNRGPGGGPTTTTSI